MRVERRAQSNSIEGGREAETMCVDDKTRDFTNKSDILFGSDLYKVLKSQIALTAE